MNRFSLVQRLFLIWIFSMVVIVLPKSIHAASINLSSSQTQLGQSDIYTVNVFVSIGSANGTPYYLRGIFYQPGTTNYCGYTFNNSDWYNGPYTTNNGWQNLLPITVQNSSWSGTLQAKLDTNDSGCSSSGTYNFKIQRFTQSGSSSFDAQNEQTLSVVLPTPTPTPTPMSTPSPTPTNTPVPTATPTQKPTATLLTNKPTAIKITLIPTASISSSLASISGEVLASSTSPTLIAGIAEEKKSSVNWFALLFIIGGIFLLSSCGILFYYWRKGQLFHENNNE